MMFRFFLPDFEFELDEWQQHLKGLIRRVENTPANV